MDNTIVKIEWFGGGHYYCDRQGNIYSDHRGYIRKMKLTRKSTGYVHIGLHENGLNKRHYAHRLIARAFIPNPHKYPFINHKNGIKWDNRVENLEWVTAVMNNRHAIDTGLYSRSRGSSRYNSKLTEDDVKVIRRRILSERWIDVYSDYQQIGWWTFRDICRGKRWKHVTDY